MSADQVRVGVDPLMETVFGPPSEPIDIAAFLHSAVQLNHIVPASGFDALRSLSNQNSNQKLFEVLSECSVNDIRQSLFEIWDDARLSAHLLKEHKHAVDSVQSITRHATKKRRVDTTGTVQLPAEVANLQTELAAIGLSSWKLRPESAIFTRTPRNTDYNVLRQVKPRSNTVAPEGLQAIVVASVYKKTTWNPGLVVRISQHALLSSQNLDQLFDTIPCASKEIPQEIVQDGTVIGYDENEAFADRGCVICIEGYAYGDGNTDDDYANKLTNYLDRLKKKATEPLVKKAASSMRDTEFRSLTLRVNQPYWMLHAGDCEHFVVFDQIRLKHRSDPSCGYPLTLQSTPLLLDLCRACSKVPAGLSVVNDIRLGESPFLICRPCWRSMEEGKGEEVIVVPLPVHRTGWWL